YNATNPSGYITGSYSLVGEVSGTLAAASVDKLATKTISISGLATGQQLTYNGTQWVNQAPTGTSLLKGYYTATAGGQVSKSTNSALTSYLPDGLGQTLT